MYLMTQYNKGRLPPGSTLLEDLKPVSSVTEVVENTGPLGVSVGGKQHVTKSGPYENSKGSSTDVLVKEISEMNNRGDVDSKALQDKVKQKQQIVESREHLTENPPPTTTVEPLNQPSNNHTDTDSTAGADSSSDVGDNPSSDAGTDPPSNSETDTEADPPAGADSSSDVGDNPSSDAGTDPPSNSETDTEADPPLNAETSGSGGRQLFASVAVQETGSSGPSLEERPAHSPQPVVDQQTNPATGQVVLCLVAPLRCFVVNVIRGQCDAGSVFCDAMAVWIAAGRPKEMRHVLVALLQFLRCENQSLLDINAIRVSEGVLAVPVSAVSVSSTVWSQLNSDSCLSDIVPLRQFLAWVHHLESGVEMVGACPLEDALLQLGEMSLTQRLPFIVTDVHNEKED